MTRTFTLGQHEKSADWALAEHLNPEQLAAATATGGPLLIVAGAGSGKTRTLTYRIAWLVEQGVDPARILLMTFTNRAARDMLQRVELLMEQEISRIWGGTFHHVGNRLLRLYGARIGIDPDFTILDRDDSRALVRTCVDDLGFSGGKRRFPKKNVLGAIFSLTTNTLDPLHKVLEERFPDHADLCDELESVRDLYTEKKRRSGVLDFDDLLYCWLRLMQEDEEVRDMLNERFQHILVDEYQDTTALQAAIVDCVTGEHDNVCVVGDDAQAIYSFRGATFENILEFQKRYENTQLFKLETNYRSTPEILALANDNIDHNQYRLPKELKAVREAGVKPAVVPCYNHNQQARFVTEYINHLLAQGYRRSDIAVLYRSHWHSMDIQLEFQRSNIPFDVRGGLRFFEQAHVKDIMAYLRVIHNSRDETAWLRILPHIEGVGEKRSHRVLNRLREAEKPLQAAAAEETANELNKKARPQYRKMIELLIKLASKRKPARLIDTLFDDFYEEYLIANYENIRSRREDVRGTIEFAEQYEDLQSFLADIALAGEYSSDQLDCGQEAEEEDSVILSTIHQAKGLEWKIVFVPWMVEGRFPPGYSMREEDGQEEEERRVFHVAITRAEQELYLLTPITGKERGRQSGRLTPSRFIKELSHALYEPMRLETGGSVDMRRGSQPRAQTYDRSQQTDQRSATNDTEPYYEYDQDVPF
ncbi:MAG: UvrD-helicase domain-containing protein [Lentisphaeria bacterium]